jgi:hypothetical protein
MDKLYETLKSLKTTELDEILDQRDSDSFDTEWCNLNDLTPEINDPLNTKDIFIKMSDITNGHEVCSYISDDLELIDRAIKTGIESDFLNYLKACYEQGKIPFEWRS